MKFSVIIPLYNKIAYVRKALESVSQQVCTDWELIIVDDGSTDESVEVVNEWVGTYNLHNSIRVVRQINAGVAVARNRGAELARGEYLCFLDADDWWDPNYLEEMAQLVATYPNAGLYATNYVYYKPGKTHVALNLPTGYINYPQAYLKSRAMPVWTGAVCMPRRVFEEMGGFPDGVRLGEDFLLWAKTAMHYPVAFLNKPLAYYNNDVPATLRATRNLHAPEHHMLWHLDDLQAFIVNNKQPVEVSYLQLPSAEEWQRLFDRLRVNGLLEYWLSPTYHEAAAEELRKVDWSRQSRSVVRKYKMPLWLLRSQRRMMQVGSFCKQKLRGVFAKSSR